MASSTLSGHGAPRIAPRAGRLASMTITDSDAKRVTAPGQIGFGSSKANGDRWDNFARTNR